MRNGNEIVISTIAGWKISPEVWLGWLAEDGLDKIDFYGCSPAYSPFSYKKENGYREMELEKWRRRFDKRKIQIFSYTPEMRNYPLNLADMNEEIRQQTVAYCENAIRDAAILEAEYLHIQAGYYYLGNNPALAWNQACRSLDYLLAAAEREKVCILTGPEDYDVTNVLDGCERTAALFEKFPTRYMKVFLPSGFMSDGREWDAWYGNTLGKRIGALGISADSDNLMPVLEKTASMEKLPAQLPLVLELSGENHADRYLSSIREGLKTAGKYRIRNIRG